jgi:hypothetical protein
MEASAGRKFLEASVGRYVQRMLPVTPEIKSLVSSQTGNSLAQFKGGLTLEFSLT